VLQTSHLAYSTAPVLWGDRACRRKAGWRQPTTHEPCPAVVVSAKHNGVAYNDRYPAAGLAGLGAREAGSDAFVDNEASNRVSRGLGYEPNGTDWDTRRGKPARIQHWRLTRDAWERVRRDDIELAGVEECLPVLGIG
jgi:hypothetical protein